MSGMISKNIPSMTVGKIADRLSHAYSTVINSGLPVKTMPSVMLWGPPGVGKSQAVRQIASEIESSTGKKVCVKDVRLLLFNPIDLRGIPTSNADKTLAVWLKPEIFQMDPGEDTVNILFLDEISAAPQSVQAAAYQITLDRVVGEHRLPDNCIVIAAGNRTTDKSVAFKMPKALANRLMHIEVEGSFNSWKEWAVKTGINEKVVGFLSFRQNYLMGFDSASDDLAFPTPRSWEMVSNILNRIDNDVDKMYPLIAGIIGTGAAVEFRTWAKVYTTLPSIEDIFDGKIPPMPQNTDAMYALTASMTSYARDHRDEPDRIANSIRYADLMPPDFSAVLMKGYMSIDKSFKERLMSIPEFARWLQSKGSMMNGSVR
ncbi:MAG: ATP-binding protein [Porcipelethomonas sp.]